MQQRYALEFIVGARPVGVDESDLPWQPCAGHHDYDDENEAWAAAEEFDAAFDHRYTHRVVEVEVEEAEEPAPAAVAPPPVKSAPSNATANQRQRLERQSQQAFERNRDQLKNGLALDWPRVHLDPYVELMRVYVQFCGPSLLTERYKAQLATLSGEVEQRSNLRRVK